VKKLTKKPRRNVILVDWRRMPRNHFRASVHGFYSWVDRDFVFREWDYPSDYEITDYDLAVGPWK